jgi:hypothetical protein
VSANIDSSFANLGQLLANSHWIARREMPFPQHLEQGSVELKEVDTMGLVMDLVEVAT